MSIFVAGLLTYQWTSGQLEPVPQLKYKPAITVGQREIVLGPIPHPDTVMEVRYDKVVPAEFGMNGVTPGISIEFSKGYVRWSVLVGTMFDKACYILKTEGTTKGVNQTKTQRIPYACQNTTTWWIRPDGKLLRQSLVIKDPLGTRQADAVFWPDRIEVSIVENKKNRSFTLYPNIDMSLLDFQFKPMLNGDKVLLPYKEFYSFDPFTQAFTKYKASVSGTFHGKWLATDFEGLHIDIEGPKDKQVVFISKENDLVKVDLPNYTSIVLNFLPHDRDPFHKSLSGLQKILGKG